MTDGIDAGSLEALVRDFRPRPSWRAWFTEAYDRVTRGATAEERLKGWRTAAMIFGDLHACPLCIFVCWYGRTLEPPGSRAFLAHIDLCLWEMGLATPAKPGPVALRELGAPATLRRDQSGLSTWLERELARFGGDARLAAEFSMRLGAIRLGLLEGPSDPTMEQLLDPTLWRRAPEP